MSFCSFSWLLSTSFVLLRLLRSSCLTERTKLTAKSIERVVLGYADEHKGYQWWDPVDRWMHIPRDVIFDESHTFYPRPSSPSTSPIEDFSFITFSDTPITHVLPSSIHSNVSSYTTIVHPTSSSHAASTPRSSPRLPRWFPLIIFFTTLVVCISTCLSVGNAPPPAQPTYGFCALQAYWSLWYASAAILNTTYRDTMFITKENMWWQRRFMLLNAPTRGILFPFLPMLIPSLVSCKWV